jgi:hypothetical protein
MRISRWPACSLAELTFWLVIPVLGSELALSPFFFAHLAADYVWVPLLQLTITAILLPVYLAFVGVRFVWRSSFAVGLAAIAAPSISVLVAVCLDYAVWGFSSGRFWAPDLETITLVRGAAQIALAITLLPVVVALIFRYISQHTQRNA